MKRVLVTGAAGFIGSRLVDHLNSMGYEVAGCDIHNPTHQFFDVGDSKYVSLQRLRVGRLEFFLKRNQINYWTVDLSEFNQVRKLFANIKPDVVVHLAAQAGVRHSVQAPMDFVKSNLNGFANVLDACHHFGVQKFLYASSSSVYGARTLAPFKENDRTDSPESFYAATKMANELLAKSYFAQYEMPSMGMRFFTVYGPWGRPDMAPILFAQKMKMQQPLQLFGNGNLKRDFTFVTDTVFAIERLIQIPTKHLGADVVNVGHSNPVEVKEFVKVLASCMKIKPEIQLAPMQISDVPMTCASDEKLVRLIGKWPNTPLKEGLGEMTKWLEQWAGH